MKMKIITRLFTFLLAVNFSAQVVFPSSHIEIAQIEIDIDADSGGEESKSEKETDKLNQSALLSKFETQCEKNPLAIHYDFWWAPPTIKMSSPPPKIG